MLEAKPVIGELPAVGQKDVIISTVWWSRDGGGKGGPPDRFRGRS